MMRKFYVDGHKDIPLGRTGEQSGTVPGRLLYQLSLWLNNCARGIEAFLIQQSLHQLGLKYIDEIPTYTSKRELRTLYKLAAACPAGARVLEIGSYLGASSCYLAAGLTHVKGRLLCVDTWQNDAMPEEPEDTFAAFQKNTYALRSVITPLRKNSRHLSASDLQTYFDLVFIDGAHTYQDVQRDFSLAQTWLAPAGIIAFHDFSHKDHTGVTRAVGEALAGGNWLLLGLVDSLVWLTRAQRQGPLSDDQAEGSPT
jgi:predicted O-methyltransferase YrrM